MDESWLPTLSTDTPQEGFELAVKLARLAVMVSQSSEDDGEAKRPFARDDAPQLIGMAQVIAMNFQTIAAANEWWQHPSTVRK
jgi:hypothetical protein